jgi:hypothetical protein
MTSHSERVSRSLSSVILMTSNDRVERPTTMTAM